MGGGLALALGAVYVGVVLVLRTALHRRRTGASGLAFLAMRGRSGPAELSAGALLLAAAALGTTAPLLDLAGELPAAVPVTVPMLALGVSLWLLGFMVTAASQAAMGASWRIGVDAAERTALVTSGPFAWVRNPIFTGMLMVGAGLVLVLPSVLALLGLAALLLGLEVQVRLVEEPYLLRTHGAEYRAYAAHVGRFLPGVGRLQDGASGSPPSPPPPPPPPPPS